MDGGARIADGDNECAVLWFLTFDGYLRCRYCLYTGPIFIFILAVLLLGEKINIISIIAILAGFIGAIMVIKPGESDFSIFVIFPILSAMIYGCASIITKKKCHLESPLTLVVAVHISFLVVGLIVQFFVSAYSDQLRSLVNYPFVTGSWVDMDFTIWGIMFGLAILNATTHFGFAIAYQVGSASIIATWEYTYLLFIMVLSFFVFHEVPDLLAILGMSIIIFAGILILFSGTLLSALSNKISKPTKQSP